MNVRCPSCETVYRVDPAKVPEQGVRARCAECPAVISVIHSPGDVSTVTSPGTTATAAATDTVAPPPLVAAEQPVEPIAYPNDRYCGVITHTRVSCRRDSASTRRTDCCT